MLCEKCGNSLPANARFCDCCGHQMEQKPNIQPQWQASQMTNNMPPMQQNYTKQPRPAEPKFVQQPFAPNQNFVPIQPEAFKQQQVPCPQQTIEQPQNLFPQIPQPKKPPDTVVCKHCGKVSLSKSKYCKHCFKLIGD